MIVYLEKSTTKSNISPRIDFSYLYNIVILSMPVISMFYGLIVSMYYLDNKHHHLPHIHVRFGEEEAVYEIPSGKQLAGSIPTNKEKLLLAWIEIHGDNLMADWTLASQGMKVFAIDPLK